MNILSMIFVIFLLLFVINDYKMIKEISATNELKLQNISSIKTSSCNDPKNNNALFDIDRTNQIKHTSPFCFVLPSVGDELQTFIGQKESSFLNTNNTNNNNNNITNNGGVGLPLLSIKNEINQSVDTGIINSTSPPLNAIDETTYDNVLKTFENPSLSDMEDSSNMIQEPFEDDLFFLEEEIINSNEFFAQEEKANELVKANPKYHFQSGTVCSDNSDQVPVNFTGEPIPSFPPPKCWIPPDTDKELHDLEGSPTLDLIFGKDGLDVIYGREGNDIIDGGNDDDAIFGDNGNDKLVGSFGDDWLVGGNGNDQIIGSLGNDYLLGGNGKDELSGGEGTDVLKGGKGTDFLDCGADEDIVLDFNPADGDIINQNCENVEKAVKY